MNRLESIARAFGLAGEFTGGDKFGTGHINDTRLGAVGGVRYVFQKINTAIFRQPEQLMENMSRVTRHLKSKGMKTLELAHGPDGNPWVRDAENGFWRCYRYVGPAHTCDVLEKPEQAYQAARAFGEFQHALADLGAPRLHETIPDFHHTPKRIAALERAVELDVCGRLREVAAEVDFVRSRASDAGKLLALQATGEIPERISHNDTKLNNVLLDDRGEERVCVIDLDTVMPGLAHFDFGDMVRTGVSPAAEDERNLDKVAVRPEMFRALLTGFLDGAAGVFNPLERELLPFSGRLITLEIGTRFLTDYLAGDTYFRVHRPGHNLDRCRTQFRLVAELEKHGDMLNRILQEVR